MERINNEYVRLDKFDLLCNSENDKSGVVRDLLMHIVDYEKNNNEYVGSFYIDVNGFYYSRLASVYEFPIMRSSIINSFIYAGYKKDLNMVFQLNSFICLNSVSLDQLGNLSSYVLEHSIDFNEYLDGEKEKLVFDDTNKSFVYKKIYGESIVKSKKIK